MIDLAVVVTSAPEARAVRPETAAKVRSRLPADWGFTTAWLADRAAFEITFAVKDEASTAWALGMVRETFAEAPVDVNAVPGCERRKKLLVADMESTIVEQELLDELAGIAGLRDRIAPITERAMRGELDFADALRERVALLAGLDASLLDEIASRITFTPGARTLVRVMRQSGAFCALVSGGFTCFTQPVAKALGFDAHRGNSLEIIDGKLTGRVIEPILGREAKLATLHSYAEHLGLDLKHTMAVGDGANDLAMIQSAALGVAFRAKPAVVAAAPASIRHGDLTALLYLQGFNERDFGALGSAD